MARTGRPTKLTDELINEAWSYVDECNVMGIHALLPTIEGLALKLHISKDTMYQWEKENGEFSDVLRELRDGQANKLMQNSLINRYNPTISKLLLSKHGYIEKTEQETTGEVKHTYEELDDEQLDAAIKAREDRAAKAS